MTDKSIDQLTIRELREECTQRGLIQRGSKADLLGRLEQYFADNNVQANTVRFSRAQTFANAGDISEGDQTPGAVNTEMTTEDPQPTQSTPNTPHTQTPPTVPNVSETIQTARELLQGAIQAPGNQSSNPSLESRLSALEDWIAQICDGQRRIFEALRRLEQGPTPERNTVSPTPTHQPRVRLSVPQTDNARTQSIDDESLYAAREQPAVHTLHSTHADRSVRFANASTPQHPQHTPLSYASEQSILIPYEDLRTARCSLPEFYGTTPEDPVRFIHNSESILYQAHIHRSGWTRTIEPQLKDAASIWWNTIKLLDLSWDEFRDEFLQKFDNPDIQSRLRAEIVSVRQTPKQSLTEFVLAKNHLSRRIATGLTEPQLVSTITGLTRDEFRTHIRLQRPTTFGDLRRIAGVLDPTVGEHPTQTNPIINPKSEFKNTNQSRTWRPPNTPRAHGGSATKPAPPNPCRHCGGPHWNSDCPNYSLASGNDN